MSNWKIFNALVVVALLVWSGFNHYRYEKAHYLSEIAVKSSELANYETNDLFLTILQDIRNNQVQSAHEAGKIEGMSLVACNLSPEENLVSGIWHEGYYRGVGQGEYISKYEYERGYQAGVIESKAPLTEDERLEKASLAWQRQQEKDKVELLEKEYEFLKRNLEEQMESNQEKIRTMETLLKNSNITISKLREELGQNQNIQNTEDTNKSN